MTSAAAVDLVIVGNLLVDDLVFADGRTLMGEAGGAALHATLGALLWPARVGVLSVRGTDYPEAALQALAARGADLAGVRVSGRPSLRTWLLHEPRVRRVIHQLDRPSHAEVSPRPDDAPAAWRDARVFHLAPMPFETQREWVRALASRNVTISLDPFQTIEAATVAAWREVLERVDVLFASEDDLRLDGLETRPGETLEHLAGGRLRDVFWKRGARGGVHWSAGIGVRLWEARGGDAVDATGAGDAFAGGYLAAIARGSSHEEGMSRALVAASFAIEDWGPRGSLAADPAGAAARLRAWFPHAAPAAP